MAYTPEQQAAVDALTFEQQAGIQAKQALLQSEEALSAGKTTLDGDALRDAKLLLRSQRQFYRERHRSVVISFEERYSLWVTKDGIEPTDNPSVYVNGSMSSD